MAGSASKREEYSWNVSERIGWSSAIDVSSEREPSSDKKWYSTPRRNAIYRKKPYKKTPGKTARLYWNVGDARNRCRRRQVYRSTNVLAIVGARPPMQQGSVRSNWISPGLWGWHGLGLEQASKERSTSSWPARWPWILLQIYPHHQSALRMIPCALEFRNRSRRPAWICKQMHPQLMTLFYNCALKIASRKVFLKYNPLTDKLSPPHHLAFCIIVRPCFFSGNMIQ